MSLTVTTVKAAEPVGPGLKIGIYSVLWDASYATGGEPLDMTADFLNSDGTIKKVLFTPDNIHLSTTGYEIFAERLKPLVQEALKAK